MMNPKRLIARRHGGMALVSSLLLLVVVTIMALAMFRSYGIQERIAGNAREKQRAVHAAEIAEQYAEYWLSSGTNAVSSSPFNCSQLTDAVLNQVVICSNDPTTFDITTGPTGATSVPWKINGTDVGVTYVPPFSSLSSGGLAMNVSTNPTAYTQNQTSSGVYYQSPRFYITDLGPAGGGGEVYQIDAAGFGSTKEAAAVIESTFEVGALAWRADQP